MYAVPEFEFTWRSTIRSDLTACPRRIETSGLASNHRSSTCKSLQLREFFSMRNVEEGGTDESVNSFLSRRFGPEFARVFGSALFYGI